MTLSPPSRGQPLDVDYIGSIVGQVNNLTRDIGDTTNAFSNINNVNVKTSKVRFFATQLNVATSVAANQLWLDRQISYPAFQNFPIITTAIFTNSQNAVGDTFTTVIKSITTTAATIRINIPRAGAVNVNLHVIAIGFNPQ